MQDKFRILSRKRVCDRKTVRHGSVQRSILIMRSVFLNAILDYHFTFLSRFETRSGETLALETSLFIRAILKQ
jgi:hypothetical protein